MDRIRRSKSAANVWLVSSMSVFILSLHRRYILVQYSTSDIDVVRVEAGRSAAVSCARISSRGMCYGAHRFAIDSMFFFFFAQQLEMLDASVMALARARQVCRICSVRCLLRVK
jgi:hypothetical protein